MKGLFWAGPQSVVTFIAAKGSVDMKAVDGVAMTFVSVRYWLLLTVRRWVRGAR